MLRIFHLLTKRFALGEKPLSLKQISRTLEIPVPVVRHLLYDLSSVGLVVEAVSADKNEIAFQPGRTIENITVKDALDEFGNTVFQNSPILSEDAKVLLSQGNFRGLKSPQCR
jgi:hypothetical protein